MLYEKAKRLKRQTCQVITSSPNISGAMPMCWKDIAAFMLFHGNTFNKL
jgi:hypothetical protein